VGAERGEHDGRWAVRIGQGCGGNVP
jgi:hypothetical protein